MKERPILFKEEMYKAILDGRKTQTRRIMRIQPPDNKKSICRILGGSGKTKDGKWFWYNAKKIHEPLVHGNLNKPFFYSPYQVGDRLWVKEPFRILGSNSLGFIVHYIFDGKNKVPSVVPLTDPEIEKYLTWKKPHKGKSSLFMFKSLARLWLEVTAVRVERVQEITTSDVWAEGIDKDDYETWVEDCSNIGGCGVCERPQEWFRRLWDSINKDRASWDSNPWVWVYEFRRIEK